MRTHNGQCEVAHQNGGGCTPCVETSDFPTQDLELNAPCLRTLAAGAAAQVRFQVRRGWWKAGWGLDDRETASKRLPNGSVLRGARPSRVLAWAWREGTALVTAQWPAIEAVADVLDSDGKISPERVSKIVSGSA